MGGETPKRRVYSRIPPPSASVLPLPTTKTPLILPSGNSLGRTRRSSISSSNAASRPLSTPIRPSRRLSSADLPDLNSTRSSTSGIEIGETPHIPRFMKATVASKNTSASSSSSSSKIPLPVRVSSTRGTAGMNAPTPSSSGSMASLNELSFSSDRCGPSKRTAERPLREGLKNIIPPPKRRRFEEIQEAVFGEKESDDDEVTRFEKRMEEMLDEYEKKIIPILEKRKKKEAEDKEQMPEMLNGNMMEEEETYTLEKVNENATRKSVNGREETPRGLDLLVEKFVCVRDALSRSRMKRHAE